MKTEAFNKKIIYNQLLAVALASIISLLFVQKICQFLNTSSKRADYGVTTTIGYSGSQEVLEPCYFLEADCHSGSQSDGFILIQDIASFRFQHHRFTRPFFISTLDQYIFFEKNGHSKAFYRSGLPSMGGPSIPIVHRRLII